MTKRGREGPNSITVFVISSPRMIYAISSFSDGFSEFRFQLAGRYKKRRFLGRPKNLGPLFRTIGKAGSRLTTSSCETRGGRGRCRIERVPEFSQWRTKRPLPAT